VGTREDQLGCRTNHDMQASYIKTKRKNGEEKFLPASIISKYAFCGPIKKPKEYRKKGPHSLN